jgi:hypothetical protein
MICACGPPAPIRLESPSLGIYNAFDPKTRTPTVRRIVSDLEITLEEFVSADKSREVFDADLADYGVLALLISVANNSTNEYTVERGAFRAFLDAEALTPLGAKDAAAQSTARVFEMRLRGQNIAYGLLTLNPAGLVVVGSHLLGCLGNPACSFNQERERRNDAIEYDRKNIPLHFEKLEFRDALLAPGGKAAGFVYFKLPGTADNLLDRITLEMIATDRHHGTQASYHLSFGR